MFYLKLLTRKYIFCILILTFSLPLYSQVVEEIDFQHFVDTFISQEPLYSDIGSDIANIVGSSAQMDALFQDSLLTLSFEKLIDLAQNPSNLLETTENESIILLIGTTIAFLEAYRSQNEMNIVLLDRIRSRMSFMAASGDNYGLIIPTYFALAIYGSVGLDLVFGNIETITGINSVSTHANIANNKHTITDIALPNSELASKYFLCDVRLSLTLYIFYQSFSIEYGVLSKNFAISFTPFVLKF